MIVLQQSLQQQDICFTVMMQQHSFKDEQHVKQQVQKIIGKLLSDKSYTNPQKISLLIEQYQKKQIKLDAKLSKTIKSQIQCITQSKESVSEANESMKEANECAEKIKLVWQEQETFHEFMQDIVTLNIFQRNLNRIIDQLSYFINMDEQMNKLQKMSQDENKYAEINIKLLNLIELRDALQEDASWQRQAAIMRKQFVKVDNFQTIFYDKIMEKFADCLKWAKQSPSSLQNCIKIIETYDSTMLKKNKQAVMKYRSMEIIKESIDYRFTEKLLEQDQLIGVIQHAKFATNDLMEIKQYVEPCFTKDFQIMSIYQYKYQENIEKHIIPYFDQIQQQEQYGHLVVLLGWIDDYQTMLSRIGLDSNSLVGLKSKVKIMMPYFIDHNRKIVEEYIQGCLQQDRKNYHRKFYEEIIRDGTDLVSIFPSDIFRFVNQQADIIKDKLKGEVFIEFVRCITEAINYFQKQLTKQILKEASIIHEMDSEQKIVDFEYKLILFINNYNECLKHAGESKQMFTQVVSEEYCGRIQKIFMNQVQKEFNNSIPNFIHSIVDIIFMNVIKESYPTLFTLRWLEDNSHKIMTDIMRTVSSELSDIENQNLIINIIHYRMLVKECMQRIINVYIDQLILFINTVYGLESSYESKLVNKNCTIKKLTQPNVDHKIVFNSKIALSEAIKKDKHIFIKYSEAFSESTSKVFMNKLITKFVVLGQLFMKKKNQFETLLNKTAEIFPLQASELINVVLIVRDDIQNRAMYLPKKGMGINLEPY